MWHRQHDNADMKDLMAIWNLDIKIIHKSFKYDYEISTLYFILLLTNKAHVKLLACVIGVTSAI